MLVAQGFCMKTEFRSGGKQFSFQMTPLVLSSAHKEKIKLKFRGLIFINNKNFSGPLLDDRLALTHISNKSTFSHQLKALYFYSCNNINRVISEKETLQHFCRLTQMP